MQIYSTHVAVHGLSRTAVQDALLHACADMDACVTIVVARPPLGAVSRYLLLVASHTGVQARLKVHLLPHTRDATSWWLNFGEAQRDDAYVLARNLFMRAYLHITTHASLAPYVNEGDTHPEFVPRFTTERHLPPREAVNVARNIANLVTPPPLPVPQKITIAHVTHHYLPLLFEPGERARALAKLADVAPGVRRKAGVVQMGTAAVHAAFKEGCGHVRDALALTRLHDTPWTRALLNAACTALCDECTAEGCTVVTPLSFQCAPSNVVLRCVHCGGLVRV
jgi:hypothetical protein